jgi:glycosyltransferase involved in cell wall biosynthesis
MAMVNQQEMTTNRPSSEPMRIVHVMRAPVGGLFRHVVDLAREQVARGHLVGLVADSSTGGVSGDAILASLAPSLALGVTRMKMRRSPHWSDLLVAYKIALLLTDIKPDVVHGHGAKGGLYARLPALLPGYPTPRNLLRVYTPHGGSLHYDPDSLVNRLYILAEKTLERATNFIPFESDYAKNRFLDNIGVARALALVVHNGIGPGEFEPVTPAQDATEFLYVGELRRCKGVDNLIEALAIIRDRTGVAHQLTLVGSGPDESTFHTLAEKLGVSKHLRVCRPMSARDAFRLGRVIVVPSRAESLPYIVLEAIGAHVPIVATEVGGVPEIFGPKAFRLTPPDDAGALADSMISLLQMDAKQRALLSQELVDYVGHRFCLNNMAEGVLHGYREASRIDARRANSISSARPHQISREQKL